MTDSIRHRRRLYPPSYVVATRPRRFVDDYDAVSSASNLLGLGEPYYGSTAGAPAPSVFDVHRPWDDLPSLVVPSISPYSAIGDDYEPWPTRGVGWRPGRRPGRVTPRARRLFWTSLNRLQLSPQTRVCVQRKQRRNVLFARGVAGRRGLGRHGVRRSIHSSWSC